MQVPIPSPEKDMTLRMDDQMRELVRENSELLTRIAGMETELIMHRLNKEKWDWMFAHSRDLLLIHDDIGTVVRVSASVEAILGYTPAEFAELGVHGIVHPDDIDGALRHLADIDDSSDSIKYVARSRHKDGYWRWIEWTTTPAHKSGNVLITSFAAGRDVTDSKLTEQELLRKAREDGT